MRPFPGEKYTGPDIDIAGRSEDTFLCGGCAYAGWLCPREDGPAVRLPRGHGVTELPRGAVTFLFSDIEGSTRLVKALRERYAQVLAEHRSLVREAIARQGGHEIDTQGDAFFVAFASAKQAVLCALEIQQALAGHEWPSGASVRVRMGIHTGQATPVEGAYTGLAVHRAARICAAARGGQVLVSQATQTLIEDEEEDLGFALVELGERRLKDLDRPVRLFELTVTDAVPEPPARDAASVPARRRSWGGPPTLIRQVIYTQTLPSKRCLLHRRLAEVLADRPGSDPGLLARHWQLAGCPDQAAAAALLAARRAVSVRAYPEAAKNYGLAIELMNWLPEAGPDLLEEAARSASWAGDPKQAAAWAADALARARRGRTHGPGQAAGAARALPVGNGRHQGGPRRRRAGRGHTRSRAAVRAAGSCSGRAGHLAGAAWRGGCRPAPRNQGDGGRSANRRGRRVRAWPRHAGAHRSAVWRPGGRPGRSACGVHARLPRRQRRGHDSRRGESCLTCCTARAGSPRRSRPGAPAEARWPPWARRRRSPPGSATMPRPRFSRAAGGRRPISCWLSWWPNRPRTSRATSSSCNSSWRSAGVRPNALPTWPRRCGSPRTIPGSSAPCTHAWPSRHWTLMTWPRRRSR